MSAREDLFAGREEQAETVAAIAEAGAALLADWARGSVQRTRRVSCGDPYCGYASCRLADALREYELIAGTERPAG